MGNNGNGLIIKLVPWRVFAHAWAQKLLSTIISAKVLITLILVYVSYKLVTVKYVFDVVIGDKIVQMEAPYLTGSDWGSLMGTVIVSFIGARVAPTLIQAVGDVLVRAKGGSVAIVSEENGEEEEKG